jgi:tight adherence protein B
MMAKISFTGVIIPAVLIILSLICLVRGIIWFLSDAGRHPSSKGRLKEILSQEDAQSQGILLHNPNLKRSLLERATKKFQLHQPLQAMLLWSDVRWRLGTLLFFVLLCAGAGLSLGFIKWGPLGGLIGGGLGLYLPYRVVVFKKKRRIMKFEKQLPDALDLLARGLKAGHSFPTGMQLVAKEMAKPIGAEFFTTYKEYAHGLDLNAALSNMCQRVGLRDLEFFTTAVMIQRETGGNLAIILEKISSLIRERFRLRNQIKALTAEGRLSGVILILLPPVLVLLLIFVNPKYEMQLVLHPMGRLMALVALSFQIVGMWMIHKIVNIKV